MNHPDIILVAPHIVRPIVNPMVFMIGTTRALPVEERERERERGRGRERENKKEKMKKEILYMQSEISIMTQDDVYIKWSHMIIKQQS